MRINIGFTQRQNKLLLAIRGPRLLLGAPATITITKDTIGRYFVSGVFEFEPESLPVSPKMVGIDVG